MEEKQINDRLIICEQDIKNLKKCYDDLCEDLKESLKKIDNVEKKLLARPSWVVSIVISALCTISTGLAVALVLLK